MSPRHLDPERAKAMSDVARWRRDERERAAAAAEHEQFTRDLRGDHDGPRSYTWLPPVDSTPSVAELLSREA